ncbi:hypothetical protein [Novosphingobium sp.]|uniref:hypothetical protein n=1 Tax=Novosphingobium sp. TaxID=1874826 RepID=UPI003D6C703D
MTDQVKPLIRRTTAMTDAFVEAAKALGVDLTRTRLPIKRDAAWTVTRREKKGRGRRG